MYVHRMKIGNALTVPGKNGTSVHLQGQNDCCCSGELFTLQEADRGSRTRQVSSHTSLSEGLWTSDNQIYACMAMLHGW